jgi:hypothetical protein
MFIRVKQIGERINLSPESTKLPWLYIYLYKYLTLSGAYSYRVKGSANKEVNSRLIVRVATNPPEKEVFTIKYANISN